MDMHFIRVPLEVSEMLLSKDLGRRHERALSVAAYYYQHANECHYSLAASNISLQESIHLLP